jgi:hypothetical protein
LGFEKLSLSCTGSKKTSVTSAASGAKLDDASPSDSLNKIESSKQSRAEAIIAVEDNFSVDRILDYIRTEMTIYEPPSLGGSPVLSTLLPCTVSPQSLSGFVFDVEQDLTSALRNLRVDTLPLRPIRSSGKAHLHDGADNIFKSTDNSDSNGVEVCHFDLHKFDFQKISREADEHPSIILGYDAILTPDELEYCTTSHD